MALAQMAATRSQSARLPPVFAATVDHGLRPESGAEAGTVGDRVRELGLPHAVLRWEGEKPGTRIQERAREARYELLFAHAARVGADTVMTAHHADDQAETILFRLTRGSGVGGLAGMARERRVGDIRLARPLLDMPKQALVAWCDHAGIAYVRDPSNDNPVFARARLRGLAAMLAAQGLGRDELLRLGRRAARAEEALAAMTASFTSLTDSHADGEARIADWRPLRAAPPEIVLRLLRAELFCVTGARPRFDRLETLALRLQTALEAGVPLRATLAGARIALAANGELRLARERRRIDR